MGARLDRPGQKINVRVYADDYAHIRARLAPMDNFTPTDLIRDLLAAWVERDRARILAAKPMDPTK